MHDFFKEPTVLLMEIVVLFFAIGLHEYAHCKFADLAGDPTPRYYGRVTLNLFKHFDPLGLMMILLTLITGFGIGWGKPAPINPAKMRNPRVDTFVAVVAGPLSNIAQAVLYAIVYRLVGPGGPPGLVMFTLIGVLLNLGLAFFNLIPLGWLDGHWLVGELLPDPARLAWYKFNRRNGMTLVLGLVLIGQFAPQLDVLGRYLFPAVTKTAQLLLGTNLGY